MTPETQKNLRVATIRLLQEQSFYASLLMECDRRVMPSIPTACVYMGKAGRPVLGINEEFFNGLTTEHRMGLLMHELLHLTMYHLGTRLEGKDAQLWNIACDVAINQYIPKALLPTGALLPSSLPVPAESKRMAEYYYELLKDDPNGGGGGGSGNEGDEGNGRQLKPLDTHDNELSDEEKGGASSIPKEMQEEMARRFAEKALEEARKSDPGSVPGAIIAQLEKSLEKRVDWRKELKRFVGKSIQADTRSTRSRRNRRLGLAAPGKRATYKAKLLVAVDTSGSTSHAWPEFRAEIDGILAANVEVVLLCMDTEVRSVQKYHKGMDVRFSGGGGTSFQPLVDAIKGRAYPELRNLDGVLFLTDTYGKMPDSHARLRWMWAVLEDSQLANVPFGKGVSLNLGRGW